MSKFRTHKNSFTSGEVSSRLLGRSDLRAFENGAATLTNLIIHPTGGVSRRPGLRHVAQLPNGYGRLISFEFNTEQVYLFVFLNKRAIIYRDGTEVSRLQTPWTADQLPLLNWTQSADTLLLVHPDVAPRKITRTGHASWALTQWSFSTKYDSTNSFKISLQPYHKFAQDGVTLSIFGNHGVGQVVRVTASADVFDPRHVGSVFRFRGKSLECTSYQRADQVKMVVKEEIEGRSIDEDWEEPAFSDIRGWPTSVCFHQDRMVIGGSRSLPNRLWMSKSSDLFNFDLGEGLDDEAIEFSILSDQVNAIRAVVSGRHLQIFTTGAEWMVVGDPIAPSSVQIFRQTRIGSPRSRYIPPRIVDGATVYVPKGRRELREFIFTDAEQAYQSNDLALLAGHLTLGAVDQDFDQTRRLLHVVQENGDIACLTIFRDQKVIAWSRLTTDGQIKAVAVVGEETFFLVQRGSRQFIEAFDEKLAVDAGHILRVETPRLSWTVSEHLEAQDVKLVADGCIQPDAQVMKREVSLLRPALELRIGLPFEHEIRPLPPALPGAGQGLQGARLRLIWAIFRLRETGALWVDLGRGLQSVPFRDLGTAMLDEPIPLFTGDKMVRALGWQRADTRPLWHIRQDTPQAFHLLSVTSQVAVND